MPKEFLPQPKPEKTKKGGKSSSKGPTKTIDEAALSEKRRQQNNINRNFGKSVERHVADLTGGTRVPMSGAIKNSVHNLEGDVSVRTKDGRKVLALIECKGTAGLTPKGEKVFALRHSVLQQATKEARLQKAIPATWIHWKGETYQNDYVIIPSEDFLLMLETLKEIYEIEISSTGDDN
jgi:hypothetical protein